MLSNSTNMKRCFDNYIKTNISGVSVDFEGLPFDNINLSSWIMPRILDGFNVKPYRDSEVKQSEEILYQINIFTNTSLVTSSDLIYNIRDTIDSCFKIGKDIVYSVSGSTVAIARVRSIIDDFPLSEDNYILAYEIDYTEL